MPRLGSVRRGSGAPQRASLVALPREEPRSGGPVMGRPPPAPPGGARLQGAAEFVCSRQVQARLQPARTGCPDSRGSPGGSGGAQAAGVSEQADTRGNGLPTRSKGLGSKVSSSMEKVKVFVRWRPLSQGELARGEAAVAQTCAEEAAFMCISVTSDRTRTKTWRGGGFTGVFQGSQGNGVVFQQVVGPMLGTLMSGHAACCFCYGHTGSGKTHTILGYGQELGLYCHAAMLILELLASVTEQPPGGFQLSVRFAELHCGRAFDLMDQRAECQVREDANGQVHFRKDPTVFADGRVRVRPMCSVLCKSFKEVSMAVEAGTALRVVGSSSLHDQSSRSHAILEMEVVTEEVLAAREAVFHEESLLVPLGKALDDATINATNDDEAAIELREGLQARVRAQVEAVAAARERASEVQRCGPSCVGGTLVLVDLAGSENGSDAEARGKKQTPQEVREGKEINQSLLFLKEVIRALAAGSGHVPFRSCRLTRVMRHWLRDGCCCAMVANVSASDVHAAKTVNTLQYATLVASAC